MPDGTISGVVFEWVGGDVCAEYGRISIAFEVCSVLEVEPLDGGLGGLRLREAPVHPHWTKDYDLDGVAPADWPATWPIGGWGIVLARVGGAAVGGAAVATDSPGLHMTERYPGSACLWDIRVAGSFRGRGLGSSLIREAERWALSRGYRRMHVETQNVNVAACRFYRSHGYTLFEVNLRAYPELPDEVQMVWGKDLAPEPDGSRARVAT